MSIAGKPETPLTPGGTAPPVVQSIEQPLDAPEHAFPNAPADFQDQNEQGNGLDAAQPSEAPHNDFAPPAADQEVSWDKRQFLRVRG